MEERERLETSVDVLRSLSQQLHRVEQEITRDERELDTAKDRRSKIEQRMHAADVVRSQLETRLAQGSTTGDSVSATAVADRLALVRGRVPGGDAPNLESCDAIEADTRAELLRAMHAEEEACDETRGALLQAMRAFRSGHPRYGRGVEANIEAADRYAERLEALQTSVVPALEKELGTRVERGLSDELMSLEAGFAHGRFLVREQVARLNEALDAIAPACGRELALEATPRVDQDVEAFQAELRRCIEEIRSGSCSAEACVERVGALIEGVSPHPQASEYARRRIAMLLDVRHAFCYRVRDLAAGHASSDADRSGSGRIADGTEVCMALVADLHRRLAGGGNGTGPRSLRLIVLGAGITRESDACLRFTLALLRRLEMQVLVVAPLGKVAAVEPFVQRVGLVHETSSGDATLQTLTIEAQR